MAGASDPLEDMLFNEVDEKAVSDLVGSLESQLVSQKISPATFSNIKREGSTGAVSQFSGKLRDQVGSLEPPQQGHPKAALNAEPIANQAISNKIITASTSSITTVGVLNAGTNLQTYGAASQTISTAPPGSVTLPAQPTSFNRGTVLGPAGTSVVTAPNPNIITTTTTTIRTASPGLQSFNGNTGAVKLVNSPAASHVGSGSNTVISTVSASNSNIIVSMTSQPNSLPNFPGSQQSALATTPTIALQRQPNPMAIASQNGVIDPKVSAVVTQGAGSQGATTSQVMNHNTLMHTKMVAPNQPVSAGQSIILGGSSSPVVVNSPISQAQSVASPTLTAGVKPTVNGVGQPTVTIVRPPGAPVMATSVQQQRPGLLASTTRTAAPQLAVRPPQKNTIQLPPGFTIPPGMVLVRTDTGQLVMVPQQVLAQAQAKTQQGQAAVSNISPQPGTATAGATIRVSTPSQAPGTPQAVRLASPFQARLAQSPSAIQKAITVAPAGASVSVKMTTPQKDKSVITGGQALVKPGPVRPTITLNTAAASASATPTTGTVPVSQEMQENVKKCKNFLSTLIKLASHNSPSPGTSKNVKTLVQDLLDAKIEPEEFTTSLQAELKSSPQPYLIPFLKKSLPALRLSLLNNQQSLLASTSASALAVPCTPTTTIIRPRLPTTVSPATGIVRTPTTALGVRRPGVQGVQTRMPMVITQTIRPQGVVTRGPAIIPGRSPVGIGAQASANQKKLNEPGGGTFRDDDDINDVASMAGVNLNEENARIMATNSELVGTKIRSCKDEAFLPPGLLHRRIMETAKRFGVTEVPAETVNYISHATQARLRSILEKVSTIAQHRTDGGKDEEWYEPSTDVRAQLRFFEQLDRMEKQRKDEQEREVLLKAAKSRARQEDPEQARLKAKAKEMQQAEQAQIRQREANLTALAAIGPRKKRKMDSPGSSTSGTEVASGSGDGSSTATSSRQQLRQRITRVNLRDFIFCLEQERATSRSLLLYKALLK